MQLQGVYTALITPFTNGEIDYAKLRELVELQIAGGVDGIVPVGTTGESPTLTFNEHQKLIDEVIKTTDKRCTIIAGTGANSTAEAIELTKYAKAAGADGSLQVTPYYNKPTQEGLYRHFSTIADASGIPIVLYNVPGRSGVPIAVDTVARLSKNENIVAIKEAAGSAERVSQILDVCDITVVSGDDALTLPMMSVGAKGVISVASNIIPAEMKAMVDAFAAGNTQKALELHLKYYCFFRDEFIETNPLPIKTAMAMAGIINEEFRLPLCEISDGSRAKLAASLKRCGII
ncbi:MAG: 4-hydroxy-tetrahydrodipicolinate synthase [Victivallales bacterium]|nr:4-hydroxy-tetrahydrodipicolinate synthase [Victivallales bacterium]